MVALLIYGIIITLIVLSINSKNNLSIDISQKSLISHEIYNRLYYVDTNFNDLLSYCSFNTLTLKNMDNLLFKQCSIIPTVLEDNNITISNTNNGTYKVCYNRNFNDFSNNSLNQNKTLTNENGDTCVTTIYNNFYDSIILSEISNFFNNDNDLYKINLNYYTYNSDTNTTERETTFTDEDDVVHSKKDYYLNTNSLFDLEEIGDSVYLSTKSKDILYQYDNSNKLLKIFSNINISNNNKNLIEKLNKVNTTLFLINNDNNSDGNLEIIKQ